MRTHLHQSLLLVQDLVIADEEVLGRLWPGHPVGSQGRLCGVKACSPTGIRRWASALLTPRRLDTMGGFWLLINISVEHNVRCLLKLNVDCRNRTFVLSATGHTHTSIVWLFVFVYFFGFFGILCGCEPNSRCR